LGTLAGGIAHNFNNVLMGIQGRASLMLIDKDPSHPDFEHLKGIEEYVQNAAGLTKDLLGFARGGKYEVRPTNLNELIKHENRMFAQTKKEIRIYGKYDKSLWNVKVDQGQMRQALLNLYLNAWQAMPGGGDLYVKTENVTIDENYVKPFEIKAGQYVKISVTDKGIGMDEATTEKIFDPFFSTQEIGKGTGLGLASVYGIVKNHGGFINVYSEKGKGTNFSIYLPVLEKEITEEKKPSREVLKGKGGILLVDDEQMIIDVGKQLVEKLGYRVITAKSGKEAIDVYNEKRNDIDIVILDMIMPGMGGGETYDRLKETNPDIKVLLSSGYSINGQAREILDRGCNGFIQKPFNMKEISHKIKGILEQD
jgi:CheY-like chemotaxis protein